MSQKRRKKLVRRIMIAKPFGHYEEKEILFEFGNKPGTFYSASSPRFIEKNNLELKTISLDDLEGYIEDRFIYITPKSNQSSPLINWYRSNIEHAVKKEKEKPVLEEKKKRARKIVPTKIIY